MSYQQQQQPEYDRDNNGGNSRRSVTNPYAAKKRDLEVCRKPLDELDGYVDELSESRKLQDESLTADNVNKQLSSSRDGAVAQPKDDNLTTVSANITDTINKHSGLQQEMPLSVNLPMWKRLPSKNLSFGSAEILTVSEVCRHGALYEGHSIRTTGALLHRHTHEDGTLSLVLQDPLSKLNNHSNSATAVKNRPKGRRLSFESTTKLGSESGAGIGSHFYGTPAAETAFKTPLRRVSGAGLLKTPHSSQQQAQQQQTSAVTSSNLNAVPAETPVPATTPKPPQNSIRLIPASKIGLTSASKGLQTKFRTPALSGRKRPLSALTTTKSSLRKPPTGEDAIVQSLASSAYSNTLWILADPQHVPVHNISIGDLVTVMGQVQSFQRHPLLNASSDDNPDDNPVESGIQNMSSLGAVRRIGSRILQLQSHHVSPGVAVGAAQCSTAHPDNASISPNTDMTHAAPPPRVLFVNARILRNDNGANLRLHQEALLIRRKLLLSTMVVTPRNVEGADLSDKTGSVLPASIETRTTTTGVLPGCGPPPYPT